jgi:hypothetical protein
LGENMGLIYSFHTDLEYGWVSRLGTSEAVAIGAYAFALRKLSQHAIP